VSALPTKHVPIEQSLIGVAALLVTKLRPSDTVSSLWDRCRTDPCVRTFDRFAAALTILYAGRMVVVERGLLQRTRPEVAV
jgi:hypothetical protein